MLNVNVAALLKEMQAINSSLTQSLQTLANIEKIPTQHSARKLVFQQDGCRLYHYQALKEQVHKRPLLIVYGLVNRPDILDLQTKRSLVEGLLEAGHDVYIIDWGRPNSADQTLTLHDYINRYLHNAVNYIIKQHNIKQVNLLGVCQGGCLSLCYSSLHKEQVHKLVTMVTPVDFHTKSDQLAKQIKYLDVELLAKHFGNIPGTLLNQSFLQLKPYTLLQQKYLDLLDILDNEDKAINFLRMEEWLQDCPDQAGCAFIDFIQQCYQDNGFVNKSLTINQQCIDLSKLKLPVLNVYASQDHIVPAESSQALKSLLADEYYDEIIFPSGHIGIFVSAKARNSIAPNISEWLLEFDSP